MKTERNILVAFILNMFFSMLEFFGGLFTGSVAIVSDSIHDFGDAMSIGVSYFLERKSKKKPNDKYTYGYLRFSVLGGLITTIILISGSFLVIYNSILRILDPVEINYNGMIIFAIIGVVINFLAAYFTRDGDSLNQKAVNLHMLEDVLGWVVVLIGAVVMRFTDISIIDPVMSILVAIFILYNSLRNFKDILDIFLGKTPNEINLEHLKEHLMEIDGIIDVHHLHVWTLDGINHYATLHAVTNDDVVNIKHLIREELEEHGIGHVTIELENGNEKCDECECHTKEIVHEHHHHHHHH